MKESTRGKHFSHQGLRVGQVVDASESHWVVSVSIPTKIHIFTIKRNSLK